MKGLKICFVLFCFFHQILKKKGLVSHFQSNGVPKVLATPLWVALLVQGLDQVYQEIPSILWF